MDFRTDSLSEKSKPRLTIGLAAYNDARFLPGALDSLLSQTFTDFDLVISDNASTDETPEIIRKYAEKDSRIRTFRQSENIGMSGNFTFLQKQGKCEYFMWAACDDRWAPNFVETILTGLEKDKSIIFGFCAYQYIDENGKPFGKLRRFDFSGSTAFTRLIRFFIGYDDCMAYSIFRNSELKDIELPVFWWLNKNSPVNGGFAFWPYILAKGKFQLFGNQPLFFYCVKPIGHFQPFRQERNAILYFLFFLLRKINVAYIQFKNIKRGSNSLLLAVIFVPILLLRIVMDTFILISHTIKKYIRKNLNLQNK